MSDDVKAALGAVARGAVRVPDEAAERRRHGRRGEAVRQGAATITFSREAELQAAAGKITATERKAEGLSD